MKEKVNSNLQLRVYAYAFQKIYKFLPSQLALVAIGSPEEAKYVPKQRDLDRVLF